MTNQRVNELLSELDEALSVEPSPAVAARVRTRIAEHGERRAGAWLRLTTAAALVALATVGGAVWWGAEPSRTEPPRQALRRSDDPARVQKSAPADEEPSATVDRIARSRIAAPPSPRAGGPVQPVRDAGPREPDVIVSPQVRLAFEQLQAAAQAGRLSAEFVAQSQLTFEPTVVTPVSIDIPPRDEAVPTNPPTHGPGPSRRGGSGTESGPMWPSRPLERTRSTS